MEFTWTTKYPITSSIGFEAIILISVFIWVSCLIYDSYLAGSLSAWEAFSSIFFLLATPIVMVLFFLSEPYLGGKFSYNKVGITIYCPLFMGLKKYHHAWSEFLDADIIYEPYSKRYYVYFSTYRLPHDEKIKFIKICRRKLESIAYFQFCNEIMDEILPYLPEHLVSKLKMKVSLLRRNMS